MVTDNERDASQSTWLRKYFERTFVVLALARVLLIFTAKIFVIQTR
jgi:hypothetical protein